MKAVLSLIVMVVMSGGSVMAMERPSASDILRTAAGDDVKIEIPAPVPSKAVEANKNASCQTEICVGDRVITSNSYTGTVIEVFSNGKFKIREDGSEYMWRIYDLGDVAKGVKSINGISEGDRVITSNRYTGTVIEVFSNGKFKIREDGSEYMWRIYDLGEVAKGETCISVDGSK